MKNIKKISRVFQKKVVDVQELENTIRFLFDTQFNQYSIVNLVGLAMNYITLMDYCNDDCIVEILHKDLELDNMKKYVHSKLCRIREILNYDENKKEEILNDLLKYRKKLENRVKVITGYNDEVEILEMILYKYNFKYKIKKHSNMSIDPEQFAGELVQFTFINEEAVLINEKIKAIMKSLPVRIAKQKFFDYVRKSTEIYYGAYVQDFKDFISIVKDTFYPNNIEKYGILFPWIKNQLKQYYKLEYKELNKDEIEKYSKELEEVTEQLENILDICNYYVEVINKLISLLYHKDMQISNITNLDSSIEKLFHIFDELNNDAYSKFEWTDGILESFKLIEGIQETWIENIDKYDYYTEYCISQYENLIQELNMSQTVNNMKKIKLLSTSSLYVDIEGDKVKQSNQQVDKKKLNKSIDELLEFMDDKFKEMKRDEKRAKISQIMSIIPPGFKKPQELYEYIKTSMEMCREDYERQMTDKLIREVMSEYVSVL